MAGGVKRPKRLKRGARVLVHWVDILSSSGKWFDPAERRGELKESAREPHCVSIGFVLDATRHYLALCGSVAIVTGGDAMHSLQIPWGNVRSVARLKVGRDYR